MGDLLDKSIDDGVEFVTQGDRLRAERLRLQVSQIDMAEQCQVSRKTLLAWEKGEQTPNGAAFAVMDRLGVDVLFVITGRSSGDTGNTLAPSERELLAVWRASSAKGRAALAAMAEALKAG